jgi:4-amino-4-deoxy-L-arabinose transferase-like glycosyltransferase
MVCRFVDSYSCGGCSAALLGFQTRKPVAGRDRHRADCRLSMAELLSEPIGNKQPLYFVLLQFWSQIFGEGETSVRFPSALMGLLAVAATYGLGSVAGNRWTGLGAAFLVAISPVMLWYSQETRMYTLTSFLLVLSCFFMVKYLSAGRVRFLAAFGLLIALGLSTHYYYLPFVIALGAGGAIWLWRDGRLRDLRILLITVAIVLATLLPRIGRHAAVAPGWFNRPGTAANGDSRLATYRWGLVCTNNRSVLGVALEAMWSASP